MVLTFSTMFQLGAKAPGFRLADVVTDEMIFVRGIQVGNCNRHNVYLCSLPLC